jgi:hypothetical protein
MMVHVGSIGCGYCGGGVAGGASVYTLLIAV